MTNFTATRAHIYVTGAVILAANHNENEDEIFTTYNSSINATTGHTHSGATGDGTKLNSTGLDLTAAYAWTGIHTFQTSELKLGDSNASHHYIFAGSDLAADRIVTLPLLTAGDTFAMEAFAQTLSNKTLPDPVLSGTVTGTYTLGGTPTISSPALSGTVTGTYTLGGSPTISVTVAGTPTFSGLVTCSAGLAVSATQNLFLDGGGDTYLEENAANEVTCYAGGSSYFKWSHSDARCSVLTGGLSIPATQQLYLDGGGDTSIRESAANVITFKVGGGDVALINSAGLEIGGTIATNNGNKYDLKGYTGGAPAATGYVSIVIDSTTYKFLVSNV